MAKVFVQAGKWENVLIGTFNRLAKKHHGEFFGTALNDGRLLFGFAKKYQARKFTNELRKYYCWFQIAN